MSKNWRKLLIAAFLEVFWVIGLAHAYDIWTWGITIFLIIVSNYLMITVAQVLPTATVYTVFVGLGAGGTVIAEIVFFGESFNWMKVLLILILLLGVIGLKSITDDESEYTLKEEID